MRTALLLPAWLLAAPLLGQGQPALTLGHRELLSSRLLNEERTLLIYVPHPYDVKPGSYPALYLLDGESHFLHVAGIVAFMVGQGLMPPVMLVGVVNTDRSRDLTPTTTADTAEFPTAGGAQKFLGFFREELLPWVEERYHPAPFRVLIGHSFGGLFALEALETSPDLFQGYVVISPSLWWNRMAPVSRARAALATHPDLKAWVYLTTGNEGGRMLAGAEVVADAFNDAGLPGLRWRFRPLPEESHGSIPHRAIYDALEFIFTPYQRSLDAQHADFAAGLAGLDRRSQELSEIYGYPIPTTEEALDELGEAQLSLGRAEQALVTLRENVRRFPGSARASNRLGDACVATGKLAEAAARYRNALQLDAGSAHPLPFVHHKLEEVERRLAAE